MSHKPIMIVGEYWRDDEEAEGVAFGGAARGILHGILRQAGIDPRECYFTSVFNLRPPANRLEHFFKPKSANALDGWRPLAPGKYCQKQFLPELERLHEEVERVKPNVIIALGNIPLWALCKKSGIKKYRGSPLPTHDNKYKVIPAWGPHSIMRQWNLRIITLADCTKARRESEFPEVRRPKRLLYLEPTLQDIADFYEEFLKETAYVSCDIETKAQAITEVGFSNAEGTHAIVIPFMCRKQPDGNYWRTIRQEIEAWKWVRNILATKPSIGQNFSYDMQYFWRTMGIPVPMFLGDTMLQHHSLQPEMEKGLGFLGSIYTNEPSWKFMRTDHSTLKKGDME